jgi:multiple sugar transport system substrate-binding protein
MRQRFLTLSFATMFLVAACGGGTGGSGAPSSAGTGGGASGAPPESENAFDPASISGNADIGAWQSSDAETKALNSALQGFKAKYPNVTTKLETISDPYRDNMVNRFGASNPPDAFYINAEYAQDWIDQGFLEPLDDYINRQGFDTSKFLQGYESIFKGEDGQTYGLAKDGNTIAMAYNTDLVTTPPATLEELVTLANSLKGKGKLKAPMCLNPGLDRGLAFMYAQGGSLLTEDGSASAIETDASKASVQWYLDLFKDGLGMSNTQLGDSWCGEALGKGDVAIAFEGGWLVGFMKDTYPKVKYAFAEMPVGSSGQKVTISYTAAYGIGADSANKDQGWTVIQYLTGPEGMQKWTEGGIALPSRSDVPVPAGFDVIVKGAEYAKPGAGFMPAYNDVQKAFGDAFVKEITDKTYKADAVVAATKKAIDTALSQ